MKLTGLHFLLTYQCTYECDHCFVWSGPAAPGVMTLNNIRNILNQANELGTVDTVYFEGGEPFMYYAAMLTACYEAFEAGFSVGIVTNGYWATSREDALEWLRPLAEVVSYIAVSSDLYHYDEKLSRQAGFAVEAMDELGIDRGIFTVAQPEDTDPASGKAPKDEIGIMYKGRAATKLASRSQTVPWDAFSECPHEDLADPGRVHVDPYGNLHVCQGLVMGNLFQRPLKEIVADYDPVNNPVMGPLLKGGPAELARAHGVSPHGGYADACHCCDHVRRSIRSRFPDILTPGQLYPEDES